MQHVKHKVRRHVVGPHLTVGGGEIYDSRYDLAKLRDLLVLFAGPYDSDGVPTSTRCQCFAEIATIRHKILENKSKMDHYLSKNRSLIVVLTFLDQHFAVMWVSLSALAA